MINSRKSPKELNVNRKEPKDITEMIKTQRIDYSSRVSWNLMKRLKTERIN